MYVLRIRRVIASSVVEKPVRLLRYSHYNSELGRREKGVNVLTRCHARALVITISVNRDPISHTSDMTSTLMKSANS